MPDLPRELDFRVEQLSKPVTVYFWGERRETLNRLALQYARRIDPLPIWFEIRDPARSLREEPAVATDRLPADRVFFAERSEELGPNDLAANLALWTVRPGKAGRSGASDLADFLRLPEFIRSLLALVRPTLRPGVLVMANIDRISDLYAEDLNSTRSLLDAIVRQFITLVVTMRGKPRSTRAIFDYVYEVRDIPGSSRGEFEILCEKEPDSPFTSASKVGMNQSLRAGQSS